MASRALVRFDISMTRYSHIFRRRKWRWRHEMPRLTLTRWRRHYFIRHHDIYEAAGELLAFSPSGARMRQRRLFVVPRDAFAGDAALLYRGRLLFSPGDGDWHWRLLTRARLFERGCADGLAACAEEMPLSSLAARWNATSPQWYYDDIICDICRMSAYFSPLLRKMLPLWPFHADYFYWYLLSLPFHFKSWAPRTCLHWWHYAAIEKALVERHIRPAQELGISLFSFRRYMITMAFSTMARFVGLLSIPRAYWCTAGLMPRRRCRALLASGSHIVTHFTLWLIYIYSRLLR